MSIRGQDVPHGLRRAPRSYGPADVASLRALSDELAFKDRPDRIDKMLELDPFDPENIVTAVYASQWLADRDAAMREAGRAEAETLDQRLQVREWISAYSSGHTAGLVLGREQAWGEMMRAMGVTDFTAARRRLGALDDGVCGACGRPRVICQPWGRPCLYAEEDQD